MTDLLTAIQSKREEFLKLSEDCTARLPVLPAAHERALRVAMAWTYDEAADALSDLYVLGRKELVK